MRRVLLLVLLVFAAPAWAQPAQQQPPEPQQPQPDDQRPRDSTGRVIGDPITGLPIPAPMQALGNIIRNPTVPPPAPPRTPVSGAPLPTAIPPNTIGTHNDGR
jgi:hypothetical protein